MRNFILLAAFLTGCNTNVFKNMTCEEAETIGRGLCDAETTAMGADGYIYIPNCVSYIETGLVASFSYTCTPTFNDSTWTDSTIPVQTAPYVGAPSDPNCDFDMMLADGVDEYVGGEDMGRAADYCPTLESLR